jgi:hypothetical protein
MFSFEDLFQIIVIILFLIGVVWYTYESNWCQSSGIITVVFKKKGLVGTEKHGKELRHHYLSQLPRYWLNQYSELDFYGDIRYNPVKYWGKYDVRICRVTLTRDHSPFVFDVPINVKYYISGKNCATTKITRMTVYLECLPGSNSVTDCRMDTVVVENE